MVLYSKWSAHFFSTYVEKPMRSLQKKSLPEHLKPVRLPTTAILWISKQIWKCTRTDNWWLSKWFPDFTQRKYQYQQLMMTTPSVECQHVLQKKRRTQRLPPASNSVELFWDEKAVEIHKNLEPQFKPAVSLLGSGGVLLQKTRLTLRLTIKASTGCLVVVFPELLWHWWGKNGSQKGNFQTKKIRKLLCGKIYSSRESRGSK